MTLANTSLFVCLLEARCVLDHVRDFLDSQMETFTNEGVMYPLSVELFGQRVVEVVLWLDMARAVRSNV